MATIELRQFGSVKHLLVITTAEEAELISAGLGKEHTQIRGIIKKADGVYETYLELQKGTKEVNLELGASLKAIAQWHKTQDAREVGEEEVKMHKKWAKLLDKASEKV